MYDHMVLSNDGVELQESAILMDRLNELMHKTNMQKQRLFVNIIC